MFHLTVAARLSLNESDNSRSAIKMHEIGSVLAGPGLELVAEADRATVRVGSEGDRVKLSAGKGQRRLRGVRREDKPSTSRGFVTTRTR
jgi:hypothetical protein